MQLDQTQIAIRERNVSEIFDLSLQVMRRYFLPLTIAILLGYAPIALINTFLCKPLLTFVADDASCVGVSFIGDWYLTDLSKNYLFQMSLLFLVTQPLCSIPITLYLGQALFHEKTDFRKMGSDFRKMLPQIFWYVFILRAPAFFWLLWLADPPTERGNGDLVFITFMLVLWVTIISAIRPYILEIILLEQNPYQPAKSNPQNQYSMSTSKRNKMLHAMHSGTLMFRYMVTGIFALLLMLSAAWAIIFLYKYQWQEYVTYNHLMVFTPIILSLIGGYLAVVRFLGYLDLRIRNEGWEVELLMRAEGARLENQLQ